MRREWSHTISNATFVRARYSAFVDDRGTTFCFLKLHEIGFWLRKLIDAEVDVRSSRFLIQSAYEKVFKSCDLDFVR